MKQLVAEIPVGRIGQPEEFGAAVAFLPADRKIVDVLGAAWCLGGETEFFLIAQNINGSGFSSVGTAGKGNFRHLKGGQIA